MLFLIGNKMTGNLQFEHFEGTGIYFSEQKGFTRSDPIFLSKGVFFNRNPDGVDGEKRHSVLF